MLDSRLIPALAEAPARDRTALRPMLTQPIVLPDDGRQSETARDGRAQGRGASCAPSSVATVTELVLADGRRPDIVGLSPDGAFTIVEVKSSIADFRADRKWHHYRALLRPPVFRHPGDVPRGGDAGRDRDHRGRRLRRRSGARRSPPEARPRDAAGHDDPASPRWRRTGCTRWRTLAVPPDRVHRGDIRALVGPGTGAWRRRCPGVITITGGAP